jgi:hypothetical protein
MPEAQDAIELIPFTCPWAQDGLQKALDGLKGAGSGVSGYKIGTRAVQYLKTADQAKVVEYWQRMVDTYCGVSGPPLPGQDTAFRVILRDV